MKVLKRCLEMDGMDEGQKTDQWSMRKLLWGCRTSQAYLGKGPYLLCGMQCLLSALTDMPATAAPRKTQSGYGDSHIIYFIGTAFEIGLEISAHPKCHIQAIVRGSLSALAAYLFLCTTQSAWLGARILEGLCKMSTMFLNWMLIGPGHALF